MRNHFAGLMAVILFLLGKVAEFFLCVLAVILGNFLCAIVIAAMFGFFHSVYALAIAIMASPAAIFGWKAYLVAFACLFLIHASISLRAFYSSWRDRTGCSLLEWESGLPFLSESECQHFLNPVIFLYNK